MKSWRQPVKLPGAMGQAVSKSEFARIYGCAPSYVSKLLREGKVAFDATDARLVDVDATLQLIEATRDLSKTGVRERWAAYRERGLAGVAAVALDLEKKRFLQPAGGGAGAAGAALEGAADGTRGAPPAPSVGSGEGAGAVAAAPAQPAPRGNAAQAASGVRSSAYHDAQTDLARAQAALKQLEVRQKIGELAEVAPMVKAITDIAATWRAALEAMPPRIAPQLAPDKPAQVRIYGILQAECEQVLRAAEKSLHDLAASALERVEG